MQDTPTPSRRSALVRIAATGAAALVHAPWAAAAEFPDRPVRLINPYATGGTIDVVARIMAERMAPHLGQTVVVEQRPGASGQLAASLVAKGPKDGYMLYLGTSSSLGFAKMLNKDLSYEPVKDFTPVAMVGTVPVTIFGALDSGIDSLADLIAAAKAKPGQLSYGTTGPMSLTHLAGEMFCQRAGIQMMHVPYTGTGARYFTDLIGGRLQATFAGVSGGLGLVKGGKLKFLGVATPRRSRQLPDVPAVGELFPGFDVPAWFGFAVAAGTPAAVVQKLEAASLAALNEPATRAGFAAAGVDTEPMGSREMSARIAAENDMWQRLLTSAGMLK